MRAEMITGTLVSLDLSKFDKEELMWMLSHDVLPMTVVKRELVRRGEDEWKVLCELRSA
jgi:hypothetical protein